MSDPGQAKPDDAPVTARPERLRLWCGVVAAFVIAAFSTVAVTLPYASDGTTFHRGDQISAFGVGLVLAGLCWLPTRPRLVADASGVYLRGILGPFKTVPWTLVRSVDFRPRWRWARLVLPGDETISLYAVQRTDAARSVVVMRALRDLHSAARAAAPVVDTPSRPAATE